MTGQYRAPQDLEAGRQRDLATTTFAYRRELRGDAATLTVRATDPFNGQAWGVRTTVGAVTRGIARHPLAIRVLAAVMDAARMGGGARALPGAAGQPVTLAGVRLW